MEIFYELLLLLVITRAFGEVAVRLGQPALAGELVAGIILGVLAHYFSHHVPHLQRLPADEVFLAISDLAVFFLMLMAGLEMHPRELVKESGGAVFVALGGLIVPLMTGVGIAWLALPVSDYRPAQMLLLGTALAITAVPVTVIVLMDLGKLHSRFGQMIVSAAIIDDAVGLLLLAVMTAFIRIGEMPDAIELLWLAGQIVLFFALVTTAGQFVLPRLAKLLKWSAGEELEFTALLVVGLAFAVLAEFLQMHFVVGAFSAGLFCSKRDLDPGVYEELQKKVSGVTTGFLAPIFFASVGLQLDPSAVTSTPGFLLLLIATAIAGKLIGAGVPARLSGLSSREALAVGVGMSGRGAVELVIAKVALDAGLFAHPDPAPTIVRSLFSCIVVMALATTVIAPICLKVVVRRMGDEDSDEHGVT